MVGHQEDPVRGLVLPSKRKQSTIENSLNNLNATRNLEFIPDDVEYSSTSSESEEEEQEAVQGHGGNSQTEANHNARYYDHNNGITPTTSILFSHEREDDSVLLLKFSHCRMVQMKISTHSLQILQIIRTSWLYNVNLENYRWYLGFIVHFLDINIYRLAALKSDIDMHLEFGLPGPNNNSVRGLQTTPMEAYNHISRLMKECQEKKVQIIKIIYRLTMARIPLRLRRIVANKIALHVDPNKEALDFENPQNIMYGVEYIYGLASIHWFLGDLRMAFLPLNPFHFCVNLLGCPSDMTWSEMLLSNNMATDASNRTRQRQRNSEENPGDGHGHGHGGEDNVNVNIRYSERHDGGDPVDDRSRRRVRSNCIFRNFQFDPSLMNSYVNIIKRIYGRDMSELIHTHFHEMENAQNQQRRVYEKITKTFVIVYKFCSSIG